MSRTGRRAAAAAVAAVAVVLLLPAAADWLVMRDGSRVETAGPWRVESRLVVFKQPDGTLASVRLSEVDLEASERASRDAEQRGGESGTAPAPPPPSEPVLRLTEKDLPPVGRPPAAEEEGGEGEGSEEEPPDPLEIVTWREVGGVGGPGIEIVGTVRNNSTSLAIGVGVTVALFDQAVEESARTDAIVTSTALQPTQTSAFRASFPGVYQYGRAELTAKGSLVRTEQPDPEEPPESAR